MNEETVKTTQATGEQSDTRTFTQDEVDRMIGARIYEERSKYADYAEVKAKAEKYDVLASESQKAKDQITELNGKLATLQKNIDVRNARDKVSAETGVPASLLTGETEEACKTQAEALKNWRGLQPNYPIVPDGGEVGSFSGGKTRDQFADWFTASLQNQ